MKNGSQVCPHCAGGFGLKYPLFDDEYFWVVCDVHPLIEGHILVIPKEHISCMGALGDYSFSRFEVLYKKTLNFLNKTYGQAGIFEHGITGQTVFHAHTHFLPFSKPADEVVPEKESSVAIPRLAELKTEFGRKKKYLFFAIDNNKFLVDTRLGQPRFFRDRFARALGAKERGNWKKSEDDAELMKIFVRDIIELKNKSNIFFE